MQKECAELTTCVHGMGCVMVGAVGMGCVMVGAVEMGCVMVGAMEWAV